MAKSKTGGSRGYIRGRVGSDVYSIGVDAKGKKQQVVRSLAEKVKNPQTLAQMRGRMIMSTVMQAVSAMRPIIDHSFDNVRAGQPCISEFIKRNYALIKDDVAAHASADNVFGLNRYQEKGAKFGAYVISVGSAIGVTGIVIDGANKTLTIDLGSDVTMGGLKSALGLSINDYFTACAILANGKFAYERFHINAELTDETAINAENVGSVFNVEGNTSVAAQLTGSSIVLTLGEFSANAGIITSRKELSGYIHSGITLAAVDAPSYTADVALPTYPVGKERFLNGGGEEEGGSPFVPEPFVVSIVSASADGSNWIKDAVVTAAHANYAVVSVTIDNFKSGHQLFFGSRYDAGTPANNRGFALNGNTTTGNIYSLNGVPGTEETNEIWLWVDGVKLEKWGSITFSNEVQTFTISTNSDPADGGTTSGAGSYQEGAECTIVATPDTGKVFQGWYEGTTLQWSQPKYTFVVTRSATLTAKFADAPESDFSNVTINGHAVTKDGVYIQHLDTLAGQYNGTGDKAATTIGLSESNVSVGNIVTDITTRAEISDGAFSHKLSGIDGNVTYYLYALTQNDGGSGYVVKAIFPYTFLGVGED